MMYAEKVEKLNTWSSERIIVITKQSVCKFDGKNLKRWFLIKDISAVSVINGGKKDEICIHHKKEQDWKFLVIK